LKNIEKILKNIEKYLKISKKQWKILKNIEKILTSNNINCIEDCSPNSLIDALATLNVSIGIPIRDLCALNKWSAIKCCVDCLREPGIKLRWFGPSSVFKGLKMYSLGPEMTSVSGPIRFYFFILKKKTKKTVWFYTNLKVLIYTSRLLLYI
jgi:hypothetical protein